MPEVRNVATRVAVNAVGLAPGGGLTFLCNQAREFERDRQEWNITYFVAPRSVDRLHHEVAREHVRVPFDTPPSYHRRVFWEQVSLPRLLAREGFDLLYSPGGFATFASPVPQLVLHHNPYHHAGREELGLTPQLLRYRLERTAAKASARRAESLVYLSQAFARAMAEVGFPPPTAVIHSGVAVDWPSAEVEPGIPLACEHCHRDSYCLAVHNWVPGKRLDWLVRHWETIASRTRRHLVVVGQPVDRRMAERLRAALRGLGPNPPVHLLEGVPRDVVGALFRHAHTYISASTLEAFPLTPFEAMSFGVPCVLSDIPEHREVAGDAALYFPRSDVGGLAAALVEADQRRDELAALGHSAASRGWRESVNALEAELLKLTSQRALRSSDLKHEVSPTPDPREGDRSRERGSAQG
jgi:glycosyltransferase involved in cell wall biosynthesis